MRLIFAGTPDFARDALAAISAAGHEVVLVLTRADKPSGRGQKVQPSPVKTLALAYGLPVFQPATLRNDAARQAIADAGADVMVVAAFGLIVPPAILALPVHGCLNIHASLLPRWRGAAPIQRAIEAGDNETGITIMQMDAGLDTGPMLLAEPIPIAADDNADKVHDRLAALGATLIVKALADLAAGRLQVHAQPQMGVTYAHKILKAEALIDWRVSAGRLADRIRAFDPFPGCSSVLTALAADGTPAAAESIKIWRGRAVGHRIAGIAHEPGAVVVDPAGRLLVACGDGLLEIGELQRAGGRRMAAGDWLRAASLGPGSRFTLPPEPSKTVPVK